MIKFIHSPVYAGFRCSFVAKCWAILHTMIHESHRVETPGAQKTIRFEWFFHWKWKFWLRYRLAFYCHLTSIVWWRAFRSNVYNSRRHELYAKFSLTGEICTYSYRTLKNCCSNILAIYRKKLMMATHFYLRVCSQI